MSRFAIRQATLEDAAAIARAQLDSWRSSYREILPAAVLDQLDVVRWTDARKRFAGDRGLLQLVAYDVTHGDIVGFCDAGPSRRRAEMAGEVYALYLVQHAKRHGLGSELLDHAISWLRAHDRPSLIIWVLENKQSPRAPILRSARRRARRHVSEPRAGLSGARARVRVAQSLIDWFDKSTERATRTSRNASRRHLASYSTMQLVEIIRAPGHRPCTEERLNLYRRNLT